MPVIGITTEQLISRTGADSNVVTGTAGTSGNLAQWNGDGDLVDASIPVGRDTLTAARTYYVRTDGNDSNDGLTDSAGGAFLTIDKAVETAVTLDLSIYDVTISVGNGTYTDGVTLRDLVSSGGVVHIHGDDTTPSNVVLNATSEDAFGGEFVGTYHIHGFKVTTTTSGSCFFVRGAGAKVKFSDMEFGAAATSHIELGAAAFVQCIGDYEISGNAPRHITGDAACFYKGQESSAITVTLTGTPAFSADFIDLNKVGVAHIASSLVTFSGSATGKRYDLSENSVVKTNGGGATYLPGDSAGSTATGAQYT